MVEKESPDEAVGVVCRLGGKVQVIGEIGNTDGQSRIVLNEKFTSAVDWIRTLSRAAISDILSYWTALGSTIWREKKIVRWSSTVRLAKRQLNWKREISKKSFFSLIRWWIVKFFWTSATLFGFRLVYRAGNICNHFFTRDFLQVRFQFSTSSLNSLILRLTRRNCTFSTKSIKLSFSECARSTRNNCLITSLRRKFLSLTLPPATLSSMIS